ncbi:xanthine dehydrogenase family protein molybdopterin-binding subunit [bacterium]|nr:xanthine dehydrogenase family protein molybdopterin-binding subunit [bacterium]
MSEEKLVLGFEGHTVEKTVKLPEGEPRPWDLTSKLEVVGKHHPRVDGLLKATGKARYTHDVRLPGMLWGVLLRSPHGAARVKSVDLTKALASPGVKAAFSLEKSEVRFHGDEVAALCAETLDQAREAVRAIKVDYEVVPCVVDATDARKEDAPRVFAKRENILTSPMSQKRGDPAAALSSADKVVKATYRTQVQTHSALETHGVVARWEDDGSLTCYASTQGTFSVRDGLTAQKLWKLKASECRVIAEHVGGGFGAKFGPGVEGVAAARLAKEAKAPVWLMVDRKGEHLSCGNRPDSVQEMQGGITTDWKLTVLTVSSYGTGGVAAGAGVYNPGDYYKVPNVEKREESVFTNAGGARAFRAPGHPQGCFALEQMVDELADAIGMDPLEVRLKNDPSVVRQEEWKIGAERIGWKEKRNKTPGRGAGGDGAPPRPYAGTVLRGVGCAAARWGGHGGPGATVLVKVDEDGSVEVRSGAQDIGTGTRTVLAAIVAEELGLEGPEAVKVFLGDTRDPVGPGSGGSRTASSIAPAARSAAAQVKDAFWAALKKALMKVADSPEGQMKGGKVLLDLNSGPKWIPFAEAVKKTGKKGFQASADRQDNYKGAGFHEQGVAGCQFAEVEVDLETGKIRVLRVVAVQDMGTIVDALTAESQVIGAVIQGVSYALFEERIMDRRSGRMLNADFLHYKIAAPADCPEIVPILFPVAAGMNNVGLLGLGEPPTIPTAAAIANAFANATGVRLREIPMTPARVLAALEGSAKPKKEWR